MGIEDIRILKRSEAFSPCNIVMSDRRVVWEAKRITGLEPNPVDA